MRYSNQIIWGAVLISIGAFHYLIPKNQVVVFDRHAMESQLIRQLAEHQASDQQINKISHQFKKTLDKVLQEYATKQHQVVLDKQFTLAGAKDITSELSQRVSEMMRARA